MLEIKQKNWCLLAFNELTYLNFIYIWVISNKKILSVTNISKIECET